MKKNMIQVVIILSLSTFLFGCGGSSGGKSSSTNPASSGGKGANGAVTSPNTGGSNSGGSTVTPTEPGVTPYAHGHNEFFPRADLYLGFTKNSSGSVYGEGDLDLAQQFGDLNCTLPVGAYTLTTSNPGVEKSIVHNYGGLTFTGVGPVSFTALLENSLSMQNQNGEWVLHAVLKLSSVGGRTCSNLGDLYFSMPLAN